MSGRRHLRVLLKVQVVQQAHRAPYIFIAAVDPREMAHRRRDGVAVLPQGLALDPLMKRVERLISIGCHNTPDVVSIYNLDKVRG